MRPRRALALVTVVLLLATTLAGCRTARVGARCRTNQFAQDRTYVLACKNGRWRRFATKQQALAFMVAVARQSDKIPPPPPDPVPRRGFVRALATGATHTCASTGDATGITGRLYCWGRAIGVDSPTPVQMPFGTGWRAMDAEGGTTCGITATDTVECWGDNTWGQLGDGTTTSRTTPVQVAGLSNVSAIAVAARFACALIFPAGSPSQVWCWGAEDPDEAGGVLRPLAEWFPDVEPASNLTGGGNTMCAASSDGTATCWGDVREPADEIEGAVSEVAPASDHTCARLRGPIRCWGANDRGQLGNGTLTDSAASVEVPGSWDGGVVTGPRFSCAWGLRATHCWGAGDRGQLGNGSTSGSGTPVVVVESTPGPFGTDAFVGPPSLGERHACAREGYGLRCWGANDAGQLGVPGGDALTPVLVPGFNITGWTDNSPPAIRRN